MSNKDFISSNAKEIGKEIEKFVEKVEKGKEKIEKATNKKLSAKEQKIKAYRKEASRMVSLANKRLKRLEKNGLQENPAYQGYLKSGGEKFSVKGKNYNQLQAEVARMKAFIDAKTSTVQGTNKYLKEMAKNTGIKYSNMAELRGKANKFFELASKTEQYLRTVEDMASAIGYQKIWQQINVYTKAGRIDLNNSKLSIDEMVDEVTKALVEHQKPVPIDFSPLGFNSTEWFTLPKD